MLHGGHAVSPQLQRCAELTVPDLIGAETNGFSFSAEAQMKAWLVAWTQAHGRLTAAMQSNSSPLHLSSEGPGA